MPTTPTHVTIRLDPDLLDAVDNAAVAAMRDRSSMMRLLLTYALETMPKGWTPR